MKRQEHLRISKEILGLKGNPEIHKILDSLPIYLHRITHNIGFIEREIVLIWGWEGKIEAFAHILADWGLFDGVLPKKRRCKRR